MIFLGLNSIIQDKTLLQNVLLGQTKGTKSIRLNFKRTMKELGMVLSSKADDSVIELHYDHGGCQLDILPTCENWVS